ncbi:MAG TPA: glycosyltransferase family 2 protein [Prolixibacteraceae bacterium]|nr:glycosyltransferase family 2 protein [Prolixibacteraceae bacterium]
MRLSIIVPVFNEEKYIEKLLHWLVSVQPSDKEIFLVDGQSTDRTREIIEQFIRDHDSFKLLINPDRYVSYALNRAIKECQGDILVRLDAHTEYDASYLTKIIETFAQTDADIVGGPMRAIGKTPLQKAVARATSTSFGIGNSQFHNSNFRGYTDTVYLGAWKRELFRQTGLFDTQLIRNQDDEFHYRAKSMGYKIFLNPDIVSYYYPRDRYKGLMKQYFQYGLFKPLVSKKVKTEIKIRHLVPPMFVLYLILLPLFLFITPLSLLPLLLYIFLNLTFSLSGKTYRILERMHLFLCYPALHLSYGSGYLAGIFNVLIQRK